MAVSPASTLLLLLLPSLFGGREDGMESGDRRALGADAPETAQFGVYIVFAQPLTWRWTTVRPGVLSMGGATYIGDDGGRPTDEERVAPGSRY